MQRGGDLACRGGQHVGYLTRRGQRGGEPGQGSFPLRGEPFRGHVARGADEQPGPAVAVRQAGRAAREPDGVPVLVPDRHGVLAAAVPLVAGEGLIQQRARLGVGLRVRHPRMRPAERQAAGVVADLGQERLVGLQHGALVVGDEEPFLEGIDQGAPEPGLPVPEPGHFQVRAHPRQQFHRGERLGQVIVGARLQARGRCLFPGPGGQQHHRDRRGARVGAQGGHQAQAVQAGHHHVGQHQVREAGADRVQGRPGRRRPW